MIIEKEEQLQKIQEALNVGDSLWIPMYSDPFAHYVNNSISFIYIYCMAINDHFIIPFRHKDCFNLNIELLNTLTSPNDIYVLAKKRFAKLSVTNDSYASNSFVLLNVSYDLMNVSFID